MRSFLLSYRLKQLSRDITKQTFSDTTERVDAEALKQAQFMLYSDMLQYAEDEPDEDYRVIYEHFVDETLKHPLSRHRQKRILCGIAVACVVTLLVGSMILQPILAENLKNVNIY